MTNLQLPVVNQLSGMDPNRNDNCVSAVIASVCKWNSGITIGPGDPKDAAYGLSYKGLTDIANYVSYAARYGVTLTQKTGLSHAEIVNQAHQFIDSGLVVLVYVPWDFNASIPHSVALFATGPGTLTAMNPWNGVVQTKQDSEWIKNGFFYSQLWTAKGDKKAMSIVPKDWKDPHSEDPNGTLVAKNGVPVRMGFRQALYNHPGGWDPDNVPLVAEYHVPIVQFHAPEFGAGQVQPFRDGIFWYTQAKGVIWEPYPGLEIKACYDLIAQLKMQIATFEQQITQLQAQLAQGQQADITALKKQIDTLQQQLTATKSTLTQIHALSEVPAA